ncbi:Proline dehydrogenase domain [Trinorchestia longiramus]|nr:Proline dehydrogenase domain [Trinorchestia longiramus]
MASVMSGHLPSAVSRCLRSSIKTTGVRCKSTPATLVGSEPHEATTTGKYPNNPERDELDLTFCDHEKAFRSKSNYDLLRALIIFRLCGYKSIVDNNMQLMKLGQKVLGKKLFAVLMKASFYGHFVAGEDQQRIQPTLEKLRSFGVKSILDYSVEEDISEETATEREMQSLMSKAAEEARLQDNTQPEQGSCETESSTGKPKMEKYTPQRQFADRRLMVSGARTYFYVNEAQCEKNMETFINCIDAVTDATRGTGFAAIKMTALGRPQLLMQLSETIARARQYFHKLTGTSGGAIISSDISSDVFKARFKQEAIGPVDNEAVQKWLDNMTYDKKGLIHLFSWSGLIDTNMLLQDVFRVPNLVTGKMEPMISTLTKEEEEMFKNMMRRLHTIFQYAQERDVRVMVDAEQTYFQPAISRLTMELMKKYNTEKAIVFNTYQCYLKSTYNDLVLDMEQCYRQNFYFGCKLVRGAYMEQERMRAMALGYEDPINPSFDATSEMYHRCLLEALQKIKKNKEDGCPTKRALAAGQETSEGRHDSRAVSDRIAIMVASHNEDTVRFTLRNMKQFGVKPEDRVICFGQLLGMCDHISLPLGQSGYSVYKYVPYGPVNEVLPYLSRRATENSALMSKLEKERSMLWKELIRRLKTGKLIYRPKGTYVPLGAQIAKE